MTSRKQKYPSQKPGYLKSFQQKTVESQFYTSQIITPCFSEVNGSRLGMNS
jgi:hypothetical protein